jgi:hypothetical protein
MTDERPGRAAADDRTETRRPARRIPPLVWIVIFLLVAWFAWAWVQRGGTDVTPQGGTMPRQAEGTSIMPAAPPNGSAPGTPARTINGPQEPGRK